MPFEKAIEQVLDKYWTIGVLEATEMSGVPAIRHLSVRASPTVTQRL